MSNHAGFTVDRPADPLHAAAEQGDLAAVVAELANGRG